MKITSLGLNPSASCFLLQWKSVCILLDCGAELTSLQNYSPIGLSSTTTNASRLLGPPDGLETPQLDFFQIHQLDYILITNFNNLYSLPYLTEHCGFKGKILATEPTVQLGRQLLLELSRQLSKPSQSASSTSLPESQLPPQLISHLHLHRKLYTESEIIASFAKIEICAFDENIRLADAMVASPHSSGYCLGACNWVIKTEYEKLVFVAQSLFNAGSVRFHAQAMRTDVLSNADCIVMSQLALPAVTDLDAQFGELCNQIGQSLAVGGNVLLPVHSVGMVLDLFQVLDSYMTSAGFYPSSGAFGSGVVSAPSIPIFYISSISDSVLEYANISAEWIDKMRQERVYSPNNPFIHTEMLETQKLFKFSTLEQVGPVFRTPCIIFVGHPSLRCGDIVSLLELLKGNPKNTIIFTDPTFEPNRCIEPFEPCNMVLSVCPLDSRLSIRVACDLMRRYSPRRLVVPTNLKPAFSTLPQIEVFGISHLDEIQIKLKRQYEKGFISPQLAGQIDTLSSTTTTDGRTLIPVKARLEHRDGQYTLQPLLQQSTTSQAQSMDVDGGNERSKSPAEKSAQSSRKHRLFGQPRPQQLLSDLEEVGIDQVEVLEVGVFKCVLKLPQLQATVEFDGPKTKISAPQEDARKLIKEVLLRQLKVQ